MRLQAKTRHVSNTVIRRLPIYLRYLQELNRLGVETVSSQEMGRDLDINPAQIRKDLAYFGEFGRKGIGYNVPYLIAKICQILKLDRSIPVALVGAGHLGIALSNYNRLRQEQLSIAAIFDKDPSKLGMKVADLVVEPVDRLPDRVKERGIRIGIVAVPAPEAQGVADLMVRSGIRAILNFAPATLRVPDDVHIRYSDVTSELQALAYYVD
ncbi:MAG: redox-sensing transcriptional repressor Rex [Alicyclobacillaceae bacterium]|nr:redox-sensing transcriptional repressor Rex [Alicyclobacillaceae bacterium]